METIKRHTTAQYLQAYSSGEIGPEVVIQALQLSGFRELCLVMSRHDLPLPCGKGREDEVEKEVREGLPLLKKILGIDTTEDQETAESSS